jgi:hypothetical protein
VIRAQSPTRHPRSIPPSRIDHPRIPGPRVPGLRGRTLPDGSPGAQLTFTMAAVAVGRLGRFPRAARGRIVGSTVDVPPGDERMDDHDLANWVGGVALGLVLAAVAWLLVSPSPGTRAGDDSVGLSDRQVSRIVSAYTPTFDPIQRCIDVAVSGCLPGSSGPSGPPTPSQRRTQRSTRPGAVMVAPPPTQVLAPSAPASVPPATPPPATPQTSSPAPAPTPAPVQLKGPVPGGNTSPPHTGPRP